MRKVYVILGPTCTGKTSLALKFCKKYDAEIISADSRQVYKFMDIGTGKVPSGSSFYAKKNDKYWVIDGVNIWGYDLAVPGSYFSVVDYAMFTADKVEKLLDKGKKVFIVGGTGLYIDVISGRRMIDRAAPDFNFRKELENESLETLLSRLKSYSPQEYNRIDTRNKVRVLRAVEKAVSKTGISPPPFIKNIEFEFIGLTGDRKYLFERSDLWLETAWHSIVLETESLIKQFGDFSQLNGLVYKSVMSLIRGKVSETAAMDRAKFDLHAYIRRQQTWFKKNTEIVWVDISDKNLSEKINNLVL